MQRRGFTLLEVLVAAGVLFIVSSAVVGLSNSIIQGTGRNADRTVINRWASEGLELVNKIRTESVKNGGTVVSGEKIWFAPAAEVATYGWYLLRDPGPNTSWTLVPLDNTVHLALNSFPTLFKNRGIFPLSSQGLEAYRLICVEAYGATDQSSDSDYINCNSKNEAGNSIASDGDRSLLGACQSGDLYCSATKDSLNRNSKSGSRLVPPGNVVKVRSVIVWQDRNDWQVADLGTIFTNWKGSEQE